jgi:sec-independent protein translocase protein TatB
LFDVAPSEFFLVILVALLVIGPKDMPRVLRTVGKWVGKARSVASQFRSGFDDMVREAELDDMEKKWAAENKRIMADHPAVSDSGDHAPQMTAQPALFDDTPSSDVPTPMAKKPRKKPVKKTAK